MTSQVSKDTISKLVSATQSINTNDSAAVIESVMESLAANDYKPPSKADASKIADFEKIHDAISQFVACACGAQMTSEHLDALLTESQANEAFTRKLVTSYERFINTRATEVLTTEEMIAGNASLKLIDFRWQMRETLFDTQSDINRVNLVVGEFIYLDTRTGNIKTFRCLLSPDVIEQIARESDIAVNVFKDMKESYN